MSVRNQIIALTAILGCGLAPCPLPATEPFGDAWIIKTNGSWHSPHMYTGDLIIADEDRGTRHTVPLTELFPGDEYRSHVSESTAGPIWGERSFHFVFLNDGIDFFSMHCWTGKRVVVNLVSGEVESPSAFDQTLAREERRRVLHFLSDCAKVVSQSDRGLDWERLYGAMLLIARYRMVEAEKDLVVLEEHSWHGPFGELSKRGYGKGLAADLQGQSYDILEGRRFSQLTLRRLGLKPRGYSQIVFDKSRKAVATSPDTRRASAVGIELASTSRQVYDRLGPPDYFMDAIEEDDTKGYAQLKKNWIDAWRYDFDPPDDFSLILVWDDSGRLGRILRVVPALWHGDVLFSDKMHRPVFCADASLNGIHLDSPDFLGRVTTVEKQHLEPNQVPEDTARKLAAPQH